MSACRAVREAMERTLMGSVLIVDDNPADRALFRTILGRAGYAVYEVARGGEALQKIREVRPHVVILDVNLPDLSGFDVCRAIRADREVASVPVLILTVRHDDADILAGLEAGADDYVAKDAASAIVLERVRRLIQFRQMSSLAMLNQQLVQIGRLLTGIIHEIRGPLSVIRGSAELLKMEESSEAESREWVDAILRNAQLLQVRLDHLMATVRNTSSDVQLVELPPLVQEAAELFAKGLPPSERDVAVETCCELAELTVRADYGRLMQVLLNLLNNAHQAIQSVGRGGCIRLRAGKARDSGRDWVVIDVIDSGPGIPAAYIDRIFEPFFSTRDGGTGYGLYFASEIIKEQGGRLSVCNNQGPGATFTIWLPDDGKVQSVGLAADQPPSSG
jgi:signal transduction histidine kinase